MEKKENENTGIVVKKDARLSYKPIKDTLLILGAVALMVIILLCSLLTQPNGDNAYVEIRYGTTLLWDIDDSTKNTKIAFPSDGSKVLTYKESDGPTFLGEGNYFEFYDDGENEPMVSVTLYSDKSVEITYQRSPKNICENMGRIYSSYTPLVCLPNNFQVMIVKDASSLPEWDY